MKNKQNLIPYQKLHEEWMKDPEFRYEYEKLEPEFQIASQMIEARNKQKMSIKDVARKAGLTPAVVSRVEGMNGNPSISLLQKIAQALNTKITLTV